MRILVILACILATSFYFLSTINASQIGDWSDGYNLPLEQYLQQKETFEDFHEQEKCLAEAIYFESRGEPFLGQVAVGVVVLRRVASPRFPNNICDVIHEGKYWKGHPVKNSCSFS